MIKYIGVFLLFHFFISSLFSQSEFPYRWRTGVDIGIAGAAIGLNLGGYYTQKGLKPLTEMELAGLKSNAVHPRFDRVAIRAFQPKIAKASDIIAKSAMILPGLLVLAPEMRHRERLLLTASMYLETVTLTTGLIELTKNLTHRTRPYTYDMGTPAALRLEQDARRSFFSGHTANTAAATYFLATVYGDLLPNSKLKPWVWAGAATLPAITGWLRVRSGKHFPTDVLAGYAMGALCGWGVARLHKR